MNDEKEPEYVEEKHEKYEVNSLREKILSLERFLSSSKLQILAQNKRYENLQSKMSSLAQDKLNLEKKLTEAECKYEETKKELDIISKEYQSLIETNCELEIMISEGDVQEQVLKENMDELEKLCTTLREQRDEQSSYYNQKEKCLKSKHEHLVNKIKNEKSKVLKELSQLKLENVNLSDELEHLRKVQQQSCEENTTLRDDIENMTTRLRKADKALIQERETVKDLYLRNNELANLVSDLKAKKLETNKASTTSLSEQTVNMIEDLVKKFYEKKSEVTAAFNEQKAEELSKQVASYEIALSMEKRRREKLELHLEEAQVELRKARSSVDSMFELSVKRSRASLDRCKNLGSSLDNATASTSTLRSPLFDVTPLCNDANVSEVDVAQSLTASNVSDASSEVLHVDTDTIPVSEGLTSVSTNSDLII